MSHNNTANVINLGHEYSYDYIVYGHAVSLMHSNEKYVLEQSLITRYLAMYNDLSHPTDLFELQTQRLAYTIPYTTNS